MTYATRQDLVDRFGEDEIIELEASGAPTQDGTTKTARALADADAIIDGFIGTRYTTPVASHPLVTMWACDVARFKMWDESPSEEIRRRYDDTISALRDVSKGVIDLPASGTSSAATTATTFGFTSKPRVFDSDSLAGY